MDGSNLTPPLVRIMLGVLPHFPPRERGSAHVKASDLAFPPLRAGTTPTVAMAVSENFFPLLLSVQRRIVPVPNVQLDDATQAFVGDIVDERDVSMEHLEIDLTVMLSMSVA